MANIRSIAFLTLVGTLFTASADDFTGPLPCSTDTALGQELGATRVTGQIQDVRPNSVLLASSVVFPPFENIEVGVSRKSRRIWGAWGSASFNDPASAQAFLQALISRFESELPISQKWTGKEGIALFTGRGKKSCLDSSDAYCFPTDGLMIELRLSDSLPEGPTLSLSCDDLVLRASHIKEVTE